MPKFVCKAEIRLPQKAKNQDNAVQDMINDLHDADVRDILASKLIEETRCEMI